MFVFKSKYFHYYLLTIIKVTPAATAVTEPNIKAAVPSSNSSSSSSLSPYGASASISGEMPSSLKFASTADDIDPALVLFSSSYTSSGIRVTPSWSASASSSLIFQGSIFSIFAMAVPIITRRYLLFRDPESPLPVNDFSSAFILGPKPIYIYCTKLSTLICEHERD